MGLIGKKVYVGPNILKLGLSQFVVYEQFPDRNPDLNALITKYPIIKSLFVSPAELVKARADLKIKTSLIYQAQVALLKAIKEIK